MRFLALCVWPPRLLYSAAEDGEKKSRQAHRGSHRGRDAPIILISLLLLELCGLGWYTCKNTLCTGKSFYFTSSGEPQT